MTYLKSNDSWKWEVTLDQDSLEATVILRRVSCLRNFFSQKAQKFEINIELCWFVFGLNLVLQG